MSLKHHDSARLFGEATTSMELIAKLPEHEACVTEETHAFVASLTRLRYLQTRLQSEPLGYPVPLFAAFSPPPHSFVSSPMFVPVVLRIMVPLS